MKRTGVERAQAGLGAMISVLVGCGGSALPRAHAPEAPAETERCQVAASQGNPLVTEWPASEKANLESRLREGGVVVAYSGCSMRLLPQCRVQGGYVWQRTTPATDVIEIENDDELYSKLPLGAAALEGELASSGRLAMQTTVSGQLKLVGLTPEQVPTVGDCTGATHLVGSLSVGAFELKSGGALEARGGATVSGIGAGAGTRSRESMVRRAGSAERCSESTDELPHPDCRSPIQMFLWPLPSAQPERGPAGTVKVSFMGLESAEPWDVTRGERFICTTPCAGWFDPNDTLTMSIGEKEKDAFGLKHVSVPSLRPYRDRGPLEVQATPGSFGTWSTGIAVTSLAGAAGMVGVALTAIGCGGDRSGTCTAGLITGGIGLLGLIPGIWLMLDSKADVDVVPVSESNARLHRGAPSLGFTPQGVGGRF